jgi:hypothetical protein
MVDSLEHIARQRYKLDVSTANRNVRIETVWPLFSHLYIDLMRIVIRQ